MRNGELQINPRKLGPKVLIVLSILVLMVGLVQVNTDSTYCSEGLTPISCTLSECCKPDDRTLDRQQHYLLLFINF